MPDLRFLAPESRNSGATKPLLYLIGVAFQSTTYQKRQISGTSSSRTTRTTAANFLENNVNTVDFRNTADTVDKGNKGHLQGDLTVDLHAVFCM